jgi:hypothetical protein
MEIILETDLKCQALQLHFESKKRSMPIFEKNFLQDAIPPVFSVIEIISRKTLRPKLFPAAG